MSRMVWEVAAGGMRASEPPTEVVVARPAVKRASLAELARPPRSLTDGFADSDGNVLVASKGTGIRKMSVEDYCAGGPSPWRFKPTRRRRRGFVKRGRGMAKHRRLLLAPITWMRRSMAEGLSIAFCGMRGGYPYAHGDLAEAGEFDRLLRIGRLRIARSRSVKERRQCRLGWLRAGSPRRPVRPSV